MILVLVLQYSISITNYIIIMYCQIQLSTKPNLTLSLTIIILIFFLLANKSGNLISSRQVEFDHEAQLLMKTQDLSYIKLKVDQNNKKIDRLTNSNIFLKNNNNDNINDEKGIIQGEERNSSSDSTPNHIIFVDDEKGVQSFDPVVYFDTVPELIGRKANRMRKSTLENMTVPEINPESIKV